MTFFLDDFDPAKVPPRRGPDIQPQGFFSSFGASFSQLARDANMNRQSQQELQSEKVQLAEQVQKRLKAPMQFDAGPTAKSMVSCCST